MKTLSTLRYLLLFLSIIAMASCDEETEPKPKEYTISVRFTGNKVAKVQADVTSTYDFAGVKGKTTTGPAFHEIYMGTFTKTLELGKFGDYDIVEVTIEGTGGDEQAYLKAEILVDGVVKNSCQVSGIKKTKAYCAVETDNL